MTPEVHMSRVKDVMTAAVISVNPNDTIQEALVLMAQYRVTVLPVTDARNRCVGILSNSDLIDPVREIGAGRLDVGRSVESNRLWSPAQFTPEAIGQRQVADLMTTAVVAVHRETSLIDAAGEMLRHRIHHLPVVDEQQRLLGIVSTMDVLAVFHHSSMADRR